MTEKLIRKVWIAVSAAILWGCGDASSYTAVDGVMLGTTLHITADVQGVSAQELYAAAMELDREAKASMSIFDPGSLLSLAQPQRDGQHRPPYRLQSASGRQHRRPERRPL